MSEILQTKVSPEELAMFWLGQNSFIFKTHAGTLVGIDLYLSRVYAAERHLYPQPPIAPEDVVIDYAVSTHDHLDHLDPATVPGVLKRSPKAVFVATPEGRDHLLRLGVPASQAVGMKAGERLQLRDFEVTAFYSIDPKEKPDTTHLGYLFAFPACKVYNMGDSSPGMAREPLSVLRPVAEAKPDIAQLPVIGDYPDRTPEQALALAKMIKAKIVIPTHYGCFTGRNIEAAELRKLLAKEPDVKAVLIDYAGRYVYRSERSSS